MSVSWARPPVAALCFLLVACGCGGQKRPFGLIPVSGRITCDDGKAIDAAVVKAVFVPQPASSDGGRHARPAEATLAADGSFAGVSTVAKNDGAIAGRYRVILQPMNADGTPCPKAVAAKYRDAEKTPLEVEVAADGPNRFELTVERGP